MTDRVSDTLRQIKRSVDELNKSTVGLTTQKKELQALGQELVNLGRAGGGIQQTTRHLRDFGQQFKEISTQFRETGKSVKEQVMPAFEGMGFKITSVGAAFGVLLEAMKEVTKESRNLQNFSKVTGFTTDFVRGIDSAARALGGNADQINSFLKEFSENMNRIRGTPGGTSPMTTMMMQTQGLETLGRQIKALALDRSIPEAQRKVEAFWLAYHKFQELARGPGGTSYAASVWKSVFGTDPEAFIAMMNKGSDAAAKAAENLGRMVDEVDPGDLDRLADAQEHLHISFQNIKNLVTAGLIGDYANLTEATSKFIDANNKPIADNIVKIVKDLGTAAKEAYTELAPFVSEVASLMEKVQAMHDQAASKQRAGDKSDVWFDLPQAMAKHGIPGANLLVSGAGVNVGNYQQRLTTDLIRQTLNSNAPTGASLPLGNLPVVPGARTGFRWPWSGGPSSNINLPLQPQMFSDQFVNPMGLTRGSLGTGNIATGWRRSGMVEDQRSNEERVADDESRKGTQDNTQAERDNTDQLRKLIEILSRGRGNAIMDLTGGGGAGGQGGAYGAGAGPMYRPGVGPGAHSTPGAGTGTHNAPTSGPTGTPSTPGGITPYAPGTAPTVTNAPTTGTPSSGPTRTVGPDGGIFAGTPTAIPKSDPRAPDYKAPAGTTNAPGTTHDNTPGKSSVFKGEDPSKFAVKKAAPGLPGLQQGGVIRDPSTVVDNRTGQPVAQVAERSPEVIAGRTTIAALEANPAAQASIARFAAAFPHVDNVKTQIYSLVQGESGMGRNMVQSNQYAGYFQLGKTEAYGSMGLTKQQFAALPFNEQMDAYTRWAQQNDPTGEKLRNLGLFNAASNINLQTQPDNTIVYPAGTANAIANIRTWGAHSNAGGASTIGGIKDYYAENDAETNRQLAALGSSSTVTTGPTGVPGFTAFTKGPLNLLQTKSHADVLSVKAAGGNVGFDPLLFDPNVTKLHADSVITPEVMAQMRTMVTQGGERTDGIRQLLRQQGVFMADNYCAETVTAMIRASGHKDFPQTDAASAFLDTNIGAKAGMTETEITDPSQLQPGDLAINTRSYRNRQHIVTTPGELGSHATTVGTPPTAADPTHFTAIGGNQGGAQVWPTYDDKVKNRFRFFRMTAEGTGSGAVKDAKIHTTQGSNSDDLMFNPTPLSNAPGGSPAPGKPDIKAITAPHPLMIPGELGPTKRWHPGAGGQTNVPAKTQAIRAAQNYEAVRRMHPRWWGAVESGRMGLGSNPLTDIAGEVGPAAQALAANVMHPAATLLSASGVQDAWNLGRAGLSAVGGLWHTTAGRLAAMGTESRASGNVLADVAGAATTFPIIGGASSALTKGAELVAGSSAAELLGAGMRVGQAGVKAGPLMLGDPDKGIPPAGGLGSPSEILHKVHGTGTINVNVRAPRGTNVSADSGGLFKKVNLNRGMSMEHADERGHVTQ